MVFELHIWGPAFGLPSVDPECLAATAYLQQTLPSGRWVLIPSSHPSISPFGQLPALRDGDTWITGFRNIVNYLTTVSKGQWDLDATLSATQRADCTAFTAFIESRGAPLLDLSLFVSSENYTTVTRNLMGNMLSWPNSWTIPSRLREKAKRRSEHLGLSALDVDAAVEEQEKKKREEGGLSAQIPNSLKRDVKSLSGLLGRGVRGTQFRLAAVTDDFLEPTKELLGGREWLLGTDGPSSLDCLAGGYLSLMLKAEVPHAWLKSSLEGKQKKLGKWVDRNAKTLFGDTRSSLPWQVPSDRTWKQVGEAMLQSFTGSLPVIGPRHLHSHLEVPSQGDQADDYKRKQLALVKQQNRQLLKGQILATCLGAATTMGLLFWAGLLRLPRRPPKNAKRDFGVAGAMLGLGSR